MLDLVDLRLLGIGVTAIRRSAPMERWASARIGIGRLAILLMLALAIPFNNSLLIQQTRDFLYPPWLRAHQDTIVVSDILMPKDVGDALQRKARELKAQNDGVIGNLLYLTYETDSMPVLTGLFEPEPFDSYGVRTARWDFKQRWPGSLRASSLPFSLTLPMARLPPPASGLLIKIGGALLLLAATIKSPPRAAGKYGSRAADEQDVACSSLRAQRTSSRHKNDKIG